MYFEDLHQFEDTMTNLAAYLIAAPTQFSRLIYNNDPDEQFTESRSAVKTRVTQHYSSALLAYGFPNSEPELARVMGWFATPFPDGDDAMIDTVEMTRLEGLLSLHPQDPMVRPRLKQLLNQRNQHFFEIDRNENQGPPAQVFDTLWSLKLLMMARAADMTKGIISDKTIQSYINQIERVVIEDKDRALLLRLQFDLKGKLNKQQEEYLHDLVAQAEDHGGMWGVSQLNRWKRVKDIVEAMQKQRVTPGIIGGNGRHFREMILNTCYVIENLRALVPHFPYLEEPIKRAMRLWWQQFHGHRAHAILRTLFLDDYDFLMVMCRTIVTVSEYIGEPPATRSWMPSLRETSRKFGINAWPELESIEKALRRWIDIEIAEPSRLKLGLSGADVLRIRPKMYNPTDDARDDMLRQSLVVKYGPVSEIDLERRNYNELPIQLRNYFVSMPHATYKNEQGQAFVIMQDLSEYFTLYETFDKLLKPDKPKLPQLLAHFLLTVHQGESGSVEFADNNHLRDIYLLPMLQHLDTFFNVAAKVHRVDMLLDDQPKRLQTLEGQISTYMGLIFSNQHKLGQFPLAYMHGDLHTRNIMIRRAPRRNGRDAGPDLEFKLIDLESLRADGDAAHDLGQLLIDLTLIPVNNPKRSISRQIMEKLDLLSDELTEAYTQFATDQGDQTFELRLSLAKARSLLRIAKSHAKRTVRYLENREDQQAIDSISTGLNLAEDAALHLENIYNTIV